MGQSLYAGPVPWEEVPRCRVPATVEFSGFSNTTGRGTAIEIEALRMAFARGGAIEFEGHSSPWRPTSGAIEFGGIRAAFAIPAGPIEFGGASSMADMTNPSVMSAIEFGGERAAFGSAGAVISFSGITTLLSHTPAPAVAVIELGGERPGVSQQGVLDAVEFGGVADLYNPVAGTGEIEFAGTGKKKVHAAIVAIAFGSVSVSHNPPDVDTAVEFEPIVDLHEPCEWCRPEQLPLSLQVVFDCPDLPAMHGFTASVPNLGEDLLLCEFLLDFNNPGFGRFWVQLLFDNTLFPNLVLHVTRLMPDNTQYDLEYVLSSDYLCGPFSAVFSGHWITDEVPSGESVTVSFTEE